MKNLYKALIVCAGIAASSPLAAQIPQFSQFHQTQMITNPAMPAMRMELIGTVGYRTLNVGGGNSDLNQTFASLAYPFIKRVRRKETHYGYAGAAIISDRTGANGLIVNTGLVLSGAYRIPLTKEITTAFGLSIGLNQRGLDASRLRTGDMYDPNTATVRPGGTSLEVLGSDSKFYPTINFGGMIFHQNRDKEVTAYFGISANNLNSPVWSFYNQTGQGTKAPLALSAIGGIKALETDQFIVTPSFRYMYNNAASSNLQVGGVGSYKLFDSRGGFLGAGTAGVGIWYDALTSKPVTSVELNQRNFRLGFAYDFLLNGQNSSPATARQMELFLSYRKYLGRERTRRGGKGAARRGGARRR